MPERLAQAMKLTNARTDSNRLDRLNLADDFKVFMHVVRSYLENSIFPSLSNRAAIWRILIQMNRGLSSSRNRGCNTHGLQQLNLCRCQHRSIPTLDRLEINQPNRKQFAAIFFTLDFLGATDLGHDPFT